MDSTSDYLHWIQYNNLLESLSDEQFIQLLRIEIERNGRDGIQNALSSEFIRCKHNEQKERLNTMHLLLQNEQESVSSETDVIMQNNNDKKSFVDLPNALINEISHYLPSLSLIYNLSFTCRHVFVSIHNMKLGAFYLSGKCSSDLMTQMGMYPKVTKYWNILSNLHALTLTVWGNIETFLNDNMTLLLSKLNKMTELNLYGPPSSVLCYLLENVPSNTITKLRLWILKPIKKLKVSKVKKMSDIKNSLNIFGNTQSNLKHYNAKLHPRYTSHSNEYIKLFPESIAKNTPILFIYFCKNLFKHLNDIGRNFIGDKIYVSHRNYDTKNKEYIDGNISELIVNDMVQEIDTKKGNQKEGIIKLGDLYKEVFMNSFVDGKGTYYDCGPIETLDNTQLPYVCRFFKCKKTFPTRNDLQKHVMNAHQNSNLKFIDCVYCGYQGQAYHVHAFTN